jgi:hypothetical protein
MVKLAFGTVGDSFSASSIRAYVAEFIATLLFVFAGVGSAIAFGEYIVPAILVTCGHLTCVSQCMLMRNDTYACTCREADQ